MSDQGLAAVTGATGFIGRNLVDYLRAEGFRVRALVRPGRALPGVDTVTGSLGSNSALAALMNGARFVFHLAGRVTAPDEAAFDRANIEGTRAVVQAAEGARVERFVHVSSLAVTGPSERGHPVDESVEPRPVTPYGRSKRKGEDVVRASNLPWVIARPCAVYGPHDRAFLDLFRAAWRFRFVPVIGDGLQELSLVHAHDVCEALRTLALTSPQVLRRVYHVAHPEITTQRGLAAEVGRAVGTSGRPVSVPIPVFQACVTVVGTLARWSGRETFMAPWKMPEYLAPAWTCNTDALHAATGFQARSGLSEGMAQTAGWCHAAGVL